jgi:hypothetical protein
MLNRLHDGSERDKGGKYFEDFGIRLIVSKEKNQPITIESTEEMFAFADRKIEAMNRPRGSIAVVHCRSDN